MNDARFMDLMSTGVCVNDAGKLQLPLPMKHQGLPDNSKSVFKQTEKALVKMRTQPDKLAACLRAMQKSIDEGFIEEIPVDELETSNPTWYLPVFAVKYAKKNKWRMVFNGKYRYHGIGINDILLQGPDLNNLL